MLQNLRQIELFWSKNQSEAITLQSNTDRNMNLQILILLWIVTEVTKLID